MAQHAEWTESSLADPITDLLLILNNIAVCVCAHALVCLSGGFVFLFFAGRDSNRTPARQTDLGDGNLLNGVGSSKWLPRQEVGQIISALIHPAAPPLTKSRQGKQESRSAAFKAASRSEAKKPFSSRQLWTSTHAQSGRSLQGKPRLWERGRKKTSRPSYAHQLKYLKGSKPFSSLSDMR